MWTGKKKQSSLAYKQDDAKELGGDAENDDDDELGLFEIMARLLIFPFAVPVFMIYVYFYARGTPIAAELDALDHGDSDSDASSEADYHTAFDRSKMLAKSMYKFLCCKKDVASEVASSNVLSYDAFMAQQEKAKGEMNAVTKAPKKSFDSLPPYEVVTDVSRTDRPEIDEDGVFVRNIFVPLSDVTTLEKLLQDIETAAIQEEEARYNGEYDDWERRESVKGDTKKVILELLEQARRKQGVHADERKVANLSTKKKEPQQSTASPGSKKQVVTKPSALAASDSPQPAPGTPGSSKKQKPKKQGHAEGTPLSERMNLDAVLDGEGALVDGPSIETVPQGLMRAMN